MSEKIGNFEEGTNTWVAVLCAARDSQISRVRIAEPVLFLTFDYGDKAEDTLVFSQIGKDEETKTAYYFKNWQKEDDKVILDLFDWGEFPARK